MQKPARTLAAALAAAALTLGAGPAVAAAEGTPSAGAASHTFAPLAHAAADPSPQRVAAIERFYDSGAWARATDKVVNRAKAVLRASARKASDPRKLVAVFDIDDTALSTFDCMKGGGFTDSQRTLCVLTGPHPAITQTRSLVALAQRLGVRVAFVTGRPAGLRTLTLQQLRSAGFGGAFQLVLRPDDDNRRSVVPFKSSARKALQRGGRHVVIDVGDQRSDLAGGFAQRTFKLPNPMYTLP
jgi:hypothetical protein